jgi:hypothetical protein
LVVGVEVVAIVGGRGGGGGRDEVTGFDGDGVAGDDETGKGGEFAAERTEGVADGVAGGGFVVAAGKEVVAVEVKGTSAEGAGGIGEDVGKNGQAEAAEEAQAVVGRREAVCGIEAGEIVEGRGHHGVCKGGKVGANVGRGGRGGGESGKVLGLETAVDVAAEVREADGAVSEVGEGRGGLEGRKVGGEEGGASGAEEGALAVGVGVPGEKVHAMGVGEMGDVSRGVRDAVGGEKNGAGVGNDKGDRCGQCGGAIAEAAEGGGKLEKSLGVGG